jgi:ferredoxin-NADP reductase
MLEEAAERGDRRPFRLLYAARSDAAFACKRRLAELSDRLNLKVTYCADEACAVPGVIRGPICSEHLKGIISGLAPDDVSVMLCGPPSMMEMAADIFLSTGVCMRNVHYERFDYGAGKSRIDRWRRSTALGILAIVATGAVLFSLR